MSARATTLPAIPAAQAACRVPSTESQYTIISATLPRSQTVLFEAAEAVLRSNGFTLIRADTAAGELETAPRFGWPAGTETESWHGTESPGVEAIVQAKAKGADSTAFRIATRPRCAVVAPGDTAASEKVGKMVAMITALQIANGVRARRPGL